MDDSNLSLRIRRAIARIADRINRTYGTSKFEDAMYLNTSLAARTLTIAADHYVFHCLETVDLMDQLVVVLPQNPQKKLRQS